MTPGRPRPVVDSGGSALAGANDITVVVQVSASGGWPPRGLAPEGVRGGWWGLG